MRGILFSLSHTDPREEWVYISNTHTVNYGSKSSINSNYDCCYNDSAGHWLTKTCKFQQLCPGVSVPGLANVCPPHADCNVYRLHFHLEVASPEIKFSSSATVFHTHNLYHNVKNCRKQKRGNLGKSVWSGMVRASKIPHICSP